MKRSILFVMIGFIVIFYICGLWGIVRMPSEFLLSADVCISSDCVDTLHNQLRECTKKKTLIRDVVVECKKKYPYIKEISICYKPCRSVVKVAAYNPLCVVNAEYILLDNDDVIEKKFFTASVIDCLPCMELSNEGIHDISYLAKTALQVLPIDVYDTYRVAVQSKNCIVLTNKNNGQFSIVCSAEQSISQELFNHCHVVRENILTKSAALDTKTKWIADTRFADYIVAYKA